MKVVIVDLEGKESTVDAPEGWRLMEVIRDSGFPIKAECGGACACATCHVYVDEGWMARLPAQSEEEEYMMDEVFDLQKNSRLSCQIILDEGLDGVKITLAENDHE